MTQTAMITPTYPGDVAALAKLSAEVRAEFEKYMDALDAEHASRGAPYGDGSLWETTGIECWLSYFEDGYSPAAALDEDQSYD